MNITPPASQMPKNPAGFPAGWTMRENHDVASSEEKSSTIYYYSPIEQIKFKSKSDVTRFLELLKETNGDENMAYDIFRANGHNVSSAAAGIKHGEDMNLIQQKQPVNRLIATLANGNHITVKVKLNGKEYVRRRPKEPRSRASKELSTIPTLDQFAKQSDKLWECPKCGRTNLPAKKRCGSCQSWRGGKRANIVGIKKKEKVKECLQFEEILSEEPPHASSDEDNNDQEPDEDTAASNSGRSHPKRKRRNVYASLSPAVIQGQIDATAKAYAMASPAPQLASKSKKRKQSFDYHPPISARDIPKEFIGKDGNLFYCRICLGVGEVVCCDGCPHVFHRSCLPSGPSKTSLENDEDPWFCHECLKGNTMIPMKKRKKTSKKPRLSLTTPRSRGGTLTNKSGGKGGKAARRISSSEERKKRSRDSGGQSRTTVMRGRTRAYSSGFQAPYFEVEEDDDAVGPESLAHVERPVSSTPAYFFFLLHNRASIERALYRKSRYFRGLPSGMARNERVASEGAAIWMTMSNEERSLWVDVAMKDYEQRLIAWKEKDTIYSMMQLASNKDENDATDKSSQPSQTDEAYIAISRVRVHQLSKINSQPVMVGTNGGYSILLELLNDVRFRPLPLVCVTRASEEERSDVNVAVQQFTPLGPIETSLGDDCTGCTRGWNHFCSVLKRPISGSEYRAKIQPPVSNLTATRIGLGLKVNLPREGDKSTVSSNNKRVGDFCPNYYPRDGFYLATPSTHLDDVTTFIDSAASMKTMQADTDGPSESGKSKALLSRGLLPMRGRKKSNENGSPDDARGVYSSALGNTEKGGEELQYRCGGCGNIQPSPLGCMTCRSSKLLTQIAKRNFCSPSEATDELLRKNKSVSSPNYGEGFAKPLCLMLGRNSLNEFNKSGRKEHRELERLIGLSLTKESWNPSVIMPLNAKRIPTRKARKLDADDSSTSSGSDDDSSRSREGLMNSSRCSSSSNRLPKEDDEEDRSPWMCTRCTHKNDGSRSNCSSCQGWKDCYKESLGLGKSSHPRSCKSSGLSDSTSQDRDKLALKHKGNANELSRKCLEIACCGILAGMIQGDPMRLFAEPVPTDVEEYRLVISDPIDFSTIKLKILTQQYTSLTSFMSDARRLCINVCVFNAAGSLYAKTAKKIYDSLEIMHARAREWMDMLKNAHSSSFIDETANDVNVDIFKDIRLMWPGAVELFEDGEWLKKQAVSDFVRTRENELAYYGSLAIQRATAAAEASLLTSPDMGNDLIKLPVMKRSYVQDELLRERVNYAASQHIGPVGLKDEPKPREHQLLKLLKRVQKQRVDGRMSSGCARCDGDKDGDETNKAVLLLRSKRRTVDATRPRVAASRLPQSIGNASRNAREKREEESITVGIPLELVGRIATESMVSVRGSRVHGWGIFADRHFNKGQVVAEYIGEYVSNAVANLRERQYRDSRIQDYLFRLDGSLVIDATVQGGYARYINHNCNPNCVAKIVDGKSPNEHLKRVLIVSKQVIHASEELSYDYKFPLEMNLDLRVPCNCGAKHCRGFLNWDMPEKSSRPT